MECTITILARLGKIRGAASKWRWCGQVKLSGFYALTTPSHAYPHTAAFGYVQLLLEAFGAERCAKLTLEP